MKICQVDPGCGIPIPPPAWGAIEKIVWEFTQNLKELGHEVDIKMSSHINPGEYDIVHCHVANLAIQLAEKGIPYIYQIHDHHAYFYGKDSHVYKENLKAIEGSLISLMPAKFLVDYFDHPKCMYFSHGVNTSSFYPKIKNTPAIPKLLMIANNGLAGDPTFDRKGFALGLGLAMLNNLEITIAGPSDNKRFFNAHLWMLNYPKLNLVFDTPNDKLLELYHNHDIFIHPTMLEAGHPNLTMVEAAAAGLPIIANWEIETDFHGAWRAPRDIFEMDKGLKDILNNWFSYRDKISVTSRELSWFNRSKELIKIYEGSFNQGV
jgi:glycosyltransferase involved in cell wall biosynthesis